MRLTDALEQALRTLTAANGPRARTPEPGPPGDPPRPQPDPPSAAASVPAASVPAASAGAEVDRSAAPDAAATAPPPEPAAAPPLARSRELERLETATEAIERLGLGYHLGSAVERVAAAAQEGSGGAPKLREAAWLIERYLELLERRPLGADVHAAATRLAREGDAIAGLLALARALESSADRPERASPEAGALASQEPSAPAAGALEAERQQTPDATSVEPRKPEPPEPAPPAAPVSAPPHVSIGRELFVAAVRALIVVVSVVAIVVALTLISDWNP